MTQEERFIAAREQMVREQLAGRDIADRRILEVMRQVPRHHFVPDASLDDAYADRALALDNGQTISQPYMVALMTQAASLASDHRVLEVGTGSGYQTAVLARLVRCVFTVERVEGLSILARTTIPRPWLDRITFRVGDGSVGWPDEAPFDRIVVTAGAPEVPEPLVDQLADGGRLVIPVGAHDRQILMVIRREGDRVKQERLVPCRFIKLIGQAGWREEI